MTRWKDVDEVTQRLESVGQHSPASSDAQQGGSYMSPLEASVKKDQNPFNYVDGLALGFSARRQFLYELSALSGSNF